MKIIVPKHVEAWLFDMWIDVWPFRLKMWQLFLVAIWVAITMAIMNWLMKHGLGKIPAFIIASPWLLIMLFIAFFRKSELHIIPFSAKLIRTYILWSPKSFQRNTIKPAEREIKLQFARLNKWEEKNITQKTLEKNNIDKNLEVLTKW
jgi:hypothetical protein